MAKVRSSTKGSRSGRSGKMACVFLVLLVATSFVRETSAQAGPDWMGIASGLLQNTFLGPFVSAINAVSGGVPNLSGALLGLTNNISQASSQLASSNGFGSPAAAPAAAASPAVFRREVNMSEHQTPKDISNDPTHDLYMELDMPQSHPGARSVSDASSPNVSSAANGAFFGSPAYIAARNATAEPQHPVSARNAPDFNSTETLHARDLMNASSASSDSSLHPKAAVNASSPVNFSSNHVRSEEDDEEATVSSADEDDDSQYVNVHARMVFKRAAVYNASVPSAQHSQQARADGDAAAVPAAAGGGANFLTAAQNANTLLANGALGATNLGAAALQATGNLAAGTLAATNNLFAQQANALGALGVQQAATLNNAAIEHTAAAEAQKAGAVHAAKDPQKGHEIPFPPAPKTTPKPVVYYTPSPKFHARPRPAAAC